jgi:ABC-2 type transport system ATP-binding protein
MKIGPVLEVRGLARSFGRVRAVRRADFSVRRGAVTVFLGRNGAGKTTTLRAVLGFIRRDAGTVVLDAGVVGYVPEYPAFFPWLRGVEVLDLTARTAGLDIGGTRARVAALAARLDMDPGILARRAATYSPGNRKKLAYLQNLILRPDFLIVDEPFSSLDPPGIRAVRALVLDLGADGASVLLSTHLVREAEEIAEDFIIIREGLVVVQDNLARCRRNGAGADAGLERLFFLYGA